MDETNDPVIPEVAEVQWGTVVVLSVLMLLVAVAAAVQLWRADHRWAAVLPVVGVAAVGVLLL